MRAGWAGSIPAVDLRQRLNRWFRNGPLHRLAIGGGVPTEALVVEGGEEASMTAAKQDLIEEGRTEGERLAHSRALEAADGAVAG